MKRDLETREDLETLLAEFYKVAVVDEKIGHHFKDLDLVSHLPIIVDFWEKVLFGEPVYFGNPLAAHRILHEKSALKLEHFQKWVEIFHRTVDKFFAGEMADASKMRAKMIAHSLNQNLNPQTEIPS